MDGQLIVIPIAKGEDAFDKALICALELGISPVELKEKVRAQVVHRLGTFPSYEGDGDNRVPIAFQIAGQLYKVNMQMYFIEREEFFSDICRTDGANERIVLLSYGNHFDVVALYVKGGGRSLTKFREDTEDLKSHLDRYVAKIHRDHHGSPVNVPACASHATRAEKEWMSFLVDMKHMYESSNSVHVRSYLRNQITVFQKAEMSLYELVMSPNARDQLLDFIVDADGTKHLRFSPKFQKIIKGLLKKILTSSDEYYFTEDIEELRYVRYIPYHFETPVLAESLKEEKEKSGFSGLHVIISTIVYTLEEGTNSIRSIEVDDFLTELHLANHVVREDKLYIIRHVALMDHCERIELTRKIHGRCERDEDFCDRLIYILSQRFISFDFKRKLVEGSILRKILDNSWGKTEDAEEKKYESRWKCRVPNDERWSTQRRARRFIYFTHHVFEHGKKQELDNNEVLWWTPMDLENMLTTTFPQMWYYMYDALVRAGLCNLLSWSNGIE